MTTQCVMVIVKGDILPAMRAAEARGIKVLTAVAWNTGQGPDDGRLSGRQMNTWLTAPGQDIHRVADWFLEPPRTTPFPDGTCLYYEY